MRCVSSMAGPLTSAMTIAGGALAGAAVLLAVDAAGSGPKSYSVDTGPGPAQALNTPAMTMAQLRLKSGCTMVLIWSVPRSRLRPVQAAWWARRIVCSAAAGSIVGGVF